MRVYCIPAHFFVNSPTRIWKVVFRNLQVEKFTILLPTTGYAIDIITCPMLCFLMRVRRRSSYFRTIFVSVLVLTSDAYCLLVCSNDVDKS